MWRSMLAATVLALSLSAALWAQDSTDGKKPADAAAKSPAQKKLLENPNDAQAISAYLNETMNAVLPIMQSNPKLAREKLEAMEAFVRTLNIDDATATSRLASLRSISQSYRARLDVQNVPLADLEKKVLDNPDDAKAISGYVTKVQMEVTPMIRTQLDLAEKKVASAKAALAKVKDSATSDAAKRQLTTSNAMIASLERSIETGRLSLADLGKRVTDNPNNIQGLSEFFNKLSMEVSSLSRAKPAEAEKKVDEAKAVLQKVEESATAQNVKTQVANYKRSLESMVRSIEAGKKHVELIGKDAAPLKVEQWVNGTPLTDADLKGKVVFLDFWAVWCGPCIVTFPHLREWNEKYADKGLVMIGLTSYYNYRWDEAANKASRSTEKVPQDEELAMLDKFAHSHNLTHRFAVQSGRSLSEFYGVTGIPHVVVIDQQGKIRLMKVGSGEANAKEIGALLAQLLDSKPAGGE